MSAQQSLDLDIGLCEHYYHCILSGIPFDLPVSQIAGHVAPQPESETVKAIAALGARIVPHQLHVYKEPLDCKFGYVSFFINHDSRTQLNSEKIDELVRKWIATDLEPQLLLVHCSVHIGQPVGCHSSERFLHAFNSSCSLLDPVTCVDTKKVETFVLSRTKFHSTAPIITKPVPKAEDEEMDKNDEAAEGQGRHSPEWQHPVGTFPLSSLKPREFVWLKRELRNFPPLLVTNNDFSTATVEKKALSEYFEKSLQPLISLAE